MSVTIQLTIFADGINRVIPLIIFRGTEDNTFAPRKREEKLFDSRVVIKFNPKRYANSSIMSFWFEFMLPVLDTASGPALLVMDLFKSHSTQEIKDWLCAQNCAFTGSWWLYGACSTPRYLGESPFQRYSEASYR